ncbi:hypothetical protein Tco_0200571 [Tanacetum coccineum]
MSNMSEDIQYAGSDTRPPMLDRTDFESWQQRIRLYCLGKKRREHYESLLLKVPFQMEMFMRNYSRRAECVRFIRPKTCLEFLTDLSAEIRKGETIHVYYVRFTKLINDMRNIKMTMPRMQLNSKFVNNMLPEWSRFITEVKLNRDVRGRYSVNNQEVTISEELLQEDCWNWEMGGQNRVGNKNPSQAKPLCVLQLQKNRHIAREYPQPNDSEDSDYFKDKMLLMHAHENGAVLDEEQLLFLAGEQVTNFDDDVDDLALNVDHVFEADQCDAFDSDVDEGPTTQTMFMANLTSKEARASYDSNIPSEVQDREYDSDCEDKYHEVHEMQSDVQHNYVVDSDADYTSDSNIIPYDQYVEDNEEHVVQSNVSSVRNDALMSILDEMHEQGVQSMKKAETSVPKPLSALTVYPPNTPVKLVPRVLPTKKNCLEYVIGTCLKSFNERDNKAPSTPVTRKKQVTFNDKPGTSSSNTQKHEVHQKVQQTNVPVIHSTRVNTSTEASGSKPRSNTKKNRIMPAKSYTGRPLVSGLRLFKTHDGASFKAQELCGKVHQEQLDSGMITLELSWKAFLALFREYQDGVDLLKGSIWFQESKSINGKKYIQSSWMTNSSFHMVKFLRSKDELPEFVINLLKQYSVGPQPKQVKQIWKPKGKLSNNSLNKTKRVWKATGKLFTNVGYQWRPTGKKFALGELCPLTRLPVTCCSKHMTGNRSKLKNFVEKFIGIYNKRTRRIMETIHVTFDEMHQTMAPVRISSGPEPIMMTPGQLNSGLAPSPVPATTYIPPIYKDLEILFQPMFDEYFEQSTDSKPVPTATVVNAPIISTNTSISITIAQDAPSISHSLSTSQVHPPVFPQGVAAGPTIKDTSITQAVLHPSVNPVVGEPSSA